MGRGERKETEGAREPNQLIQEFGAIADLYCRYNDSKFRNTMLGIWLQYQTRGSPYL